MNVVDISKFEDKLREAERRLGIQDGVPVIFERGTDTAGKLLVSLIVVGILISLLARSKSIRPPISMDTFVIKHYNKNSLQLVKIINFRLNWDALSSL